jgi:hypothetical protein
MIFIGANTTPAVLPVTLANGTTADADQVMADFNALKNYANANTNAIHATTGTPSVQVLTYIATPLALIAGSAFLFTVGIGLGNTGPATLNVNGTGAKDLSVNGVPLEGGELTPGMVVFVVYDGIRYQIVGASGSTSFTSNNILINPGMVIDQEHEGANVPVPTGTATYIIDGWVATLSSAATIRGQQSTNAPPGFSNSLFIGTTAGAAVGAGDFLAVSQPIEANNITDWAIGTSAARHLVLSFYVISSIGSYTMCGSLQNAAGTRSYPFDIAITSAGVWEQKFVAIPLDIAGGWITTGAAAGALLNFALAVGSTFQSPANAWVTGNFFGTPSCTNTLLSTNGATFAIAGVSLTIGSAPSLFIQRSFAEDLALCQRYYEKSYNYGVALQTAVGAGACNVTFAGDSAGSPVGGTTFWKVNKRATPTISIYDGAGTAGVVSYYFGGWTNGGAITGSALASEIGMYLQTDIMSAPKINFEFVADARL